MSKIIEFIIDNIDQLTFFDFVIILFVLVISLFVLFLIFQWLYKEKFKSQKDLITIKDELIDEYKSRVELLKHEKISLRQILTDVVNNYKKYHISVKDKDTYSRKYLDIIVNSVNHVILKCFVMMTYCRLLYSIKSMIWYYNEMAVHKYFKEAPEPSLLNNQLDELYNYINTSIDKSLKIISTSDKNILDKLNDILSDKDFNSKYLDKKFDNIQEQMDYYALKLSEKYIESA